MYIQQKKATTYLLDCHNKAEEGLCCLGVNFGFYSPNYNLFCRDSSGRFWKFSLNYASCSSCCLEMTHAFFVSEKMTLCQLLVHVETAFNCLMELGHNGGLQFNNVYDEDRILNGMYVKQVMHCYELLRIVEFLEEHMEILNIKPTFYTNIDTEERPRESDIELYDVRLRRLNKQLHDVSEHYYTLERRKNFITEQMYALQKAQDFLESDDTSKRYSDAVVEQLLKDQSGGHPLSTQLNYIIGSINVNDFPAFELLLYRLFGRNLMLRYSEMPEKVWEKVGQKRELVRKYVILLMTISVNYRPKLLKCCAAFHVSIFECPETHTQRLQLINQTEKDIEDMELVINETQTVRKQLVTIAATDIFIIRVNLRKSMTVYDLMNRLNPVGGQDHQKYLQAECFAPRSDINGVRAALLRGMKDRDGLEDTSSPPILTRRGHSVKHMPPTHFRLNKFTKGFQNLIDSYGMADYRELNPAPYTVITFPFLFAIMFGDFGHGLILTLFAYGLIRHEKRIEDMQRTSESENEILGILFTGRYIILLMGLFSMYVGLIYNDIMSKTINIFGSSWSVVYNTSTIMSAQNDLQFNPNDPRFYSGHPYPFGLDPIWNICGEDSITTFNSLKMKMAIILGISQMMFGLILSAVNCFHLNRPADFWLVVLPQTIFFICLFVYLVFLIFFKWLAFGGLKESPYNTACAPSVLITFIDMMLQKSTDLSVKGCQQGMFPMERILEYILVFVAFAAVPILLAGKPIYLTRLQKQVTKSQAAEDRNIADLQKKGRDTINEMRSSLRYSVDFQSTDTFEKVSTASKSTLDHVVEFDLTEVWIHSGIHTIESVLGAVSHTASYLRLWALSLAHSQLAHVLWSMVLSRGLKNSLPLIVGVPMLAITFLIWAILTVAILVMMEGLSAFLHTLRLHWVEFQTKFFNGAGNRFIPFHFPASNIRS